MKENDEKYKILCGNETYFIRKRKEGRKEGRKKNRIHAPLRIACLMCCAFVRFLCGRLPREFRMYAHTSFSARLLFPPSLVAYCMYKIILPVSKAVPQGIRKRTELENVSDADA